MATGSGTGTAASAVTEPVTRAEAKTHLNIDHTNDDDYIDGLITAARRRAELFCRRKFITATLTGYMHNWPAGDAIVLPYGNLQSVTSVTYTDTAGTAATFSTDDYIVETATEPGRIVLGYGKSWPSASLYPSNPIAIVFAAGYGTTTDTVPDMIRHAIKIMVADMYEQREDFLTGTIHKYLDAVKNLLIPYRLWPGSPVRVVLT